ncbi:MAG TPA: dTMP kinase [Rhodanobacteraceae bacterium]|nr:dTMP kinase [Rhodanobacteraceae bacterium]
MNSARGKLITLEGGEGAGKSTLLTGLHAHLERTGIEVLQTREPGGTSLGEAIRLLVLDPSLRVIAPQTEALLMFAARAQLVREVLRPCLAAGRWILCDRYTDASYAYQGGGRGLDPALIAQLEAIATDGLQPDLTLLLDLPVAHGRERTHVRGDADRIEREDDGFFERVRHAYLARATAEPQRFRVLDAARPADEVLAAAIAAVNDLREGEHA